MAGFATPIPSPFRIYWIESELRDDMTMFHGFKEQSINNIAVFPLTFHFPEDHPLVRYAEKGKKVNLCYDENDDKPKTLTIYDVSKRSLYGQRGITDLELYLRP